MLVNESVPYLDNQIGHALNAISWKGGKGAKYEDVTFVLKKTLALASSLRTLLVDSFGADLQEQLHGQQQERQPQRQTRKQFKQQQESVAARVATAGGPPSDAAAGPFRDLDKRVACLYKDLDDFLKSK